MRDFNTLLEPYMLQATEGEAIWFLTNRMTIKASEASTGGGLTVIEVVAVPGGTAGGEKSPSFGR